LSAVTFAPNPNMVTAAVADVECSGAIAQVQLKYSSGTGDSGETPRSPVAECPLRLDVLGLLAGTTYQTEVIAWGQGGDSIVRRGPDVTTDTLPSDLPRPVAQAIEYGPSGFTAYAALDQTGGPARGFGFVVDSAGRIRWYVRRNTYVSDLAPQTNGHYTLSVGQIEPLAFGTLGYLSTEYHELDVAGNLVRKWTATGGYPTDNHEILLTARGTALLMAFDIRTMDLSAMGGASNAQVLANILQEVDSRGRVLFQWNAFDHLSITDIDPSVPIDRPRIDWNHANAIDIDTDGNYLVSFRHLSEVTKIDSRTGTVIWRLGGVRNQFLFQGDTLKFSFQHGVRRLPNGNVILFDNGNGHNPQFSRAIEYRLDEANRTATAVWTYRPAPDVFSFALGLAQQLGNGNTLVTFGTAGTVHEVSPTSDLVWTLTVPPSYWIYRAYRIHSLYQPVLQ
jgi:hypothetical protein